MSETAKLNLPDGQSIELPVITGTENEKAIDISQLRAKTGHITLDPGYGNTGSCTSKITFIDGEKGVLRHRGISIEDLAANASFVEVAYLLIFGHLPTLEEHGRFAQELRHHALIHEDMKHFFDSFSSSAHPMAILSAMVASLSAYYGQATGEASMENFEMDAIRLISKIRTLAAFSYRKSIGKPFIYPKSALPYCENFLRMMFNMPEEDYIPDPEVTNALNLLLILHADHEQNCSTSTVRSVGSTKANLFASVASGILALWGPLHGGANQQVVNMLEMIKEDGSNVDKYVAKAKDSKDPFRLMGFGHRVYKNYDPRAKVIKGACDKVLEKLGVHDPVLEVAKRLEEHALSDDYFKELKLFPNVDFYSGIIYRAIGIPTDMFTVIFTIGRVPGWIAHWKEMMEEPKTRIVRPRQVYNGDTNSKYIPRSDRS
ncbi:MAG: citrate synthase [SAR324 cluster bacterium]|nr:citrate synthase [SAR324 cluster bacterium]